MKLTGAELVMKLLERQGIKRVAGIPGGRICRFMMLLTKAPSGISWHVITGGGFYGAGEARRTGRAAVCFATTGPGQ
jgi:acetolactate synthase-1/2/3 large subunit